MNLNDVTAIQSKYQVPYLIASILNYNHLSDEQIKDVLYGDDSYRLNKAECIAKAKERILKAKEMKEKIFISGDYDADGICSVAIMKHTLDKLGITNGYYIPDRFKDGYGITPKIIDMAADKGYTLIITVDNGIKAYEALDHANERKIDVIVSDHHIIEKPLDTITVHPEYMDADFKGLCGAGCALQIARSVIGEDDLNDVIAMVATIGDMMLLFNENRRIVKKGLGKVNRFPSVTTLIGKTDHIKSEDISFSLVPKLNAIGRLKDDSNPNVLVKYLLCENTLSIQTCARQIEQKNNERKQLSQNFAVKAEKMINIEDKIIMVYDENFEEGMVGLVAGKLARKYHKPAIVFSKGDNGILKASGRSVPGFDLHAFFTRFELPTFGGHSQAIGFSIDDDFEDFKAIVLAEAEDEEIKEVADEPILCTTEDLSVDNVMSFDKLEPFGMGFKKPEFMVKNAEILNARLLKEKYLKFELAHNVEAICFDESKKTVKNPSIIIGSPSINSFNHHMKVSINIKEME